MMICAVIKGPSFKEAHQQVAQAIGQADLVELRLDFFSTLDFPSLSTLRQTFALPMIFTLRSQLHGGNYLHDEQSRLSTIRRLVELKPDYLDLESHIPHAFIDEISSENPDIKIIISEHDFMHTPEGFSSLYEEMKKKPAHMYKMAFQTHRPVDALRLLCSVKAFDSPVNVIGMGEHGQVSRILGPTVGCPITYACLNEGLQTAPGQLTIAALKELYRYPALNTQTALFGLIGDPVDQSISHRTHNALMKECGLNAVYVKMEVKESELAEFLKLAKQLPFRGLSVTMPLKEVILPYLDKIDPQAQDIGAVNTLCFDGRELHGYNTDGMGGLNAVEKIIQVKDRRIVILGAGGSARAIVYEARRRGAHVTILNRDGDKAMKLAEHFGCQGFGLDAMGGCFVDGYDILINTTPVSMPIKIDHIRCGAVVMDIKVNAKDHMLLDHALRKGCRIIPFHRMFVEQAVGQFAIWYEGQLDLQRCGDILEKEARAYFSQLSSKSPSKSSSKSSSTPSSEPSSP